MLEACIRSIPADEKLVIINSGIGYGKALNIGMKLAQGKFLVIANNDTILEGDLRALLDDKQITIPAVENTMDNLPRSFYVLPRWIYEKVGEFDEQFFPGYFEDDDMIKRWQLAGVSFSYRPEVKVKHVGGHTLNNHPERQKIFDENKRKFEAKWGTLPS